MKVALFAPPDVRAQIVSAPVSVVYLTPLPDERLHSEFDVHRWFIETQPDVTVILLPQLPSKTYAEFILQLRGYTNVITAAMGFTKSLRVLGAGTSLCRVLGELCEWIAADYRVNFARIGRWVGDPVLAIENVLAQEEANANSTEGALQGGEVPDEVVPQPGCCEQYGPAVNALLEVPFQAAQGATSSDVRPERDSAASEETQGAVQHYAGPI